MFRYAINGIVAAFKTQRNVRIHFVVSLMVVAAGFYFHVSELEWVSLILCSGLVLGAEILNTATEEIVNFISPEHHPKAGLIKDLAAGAVLVTAIAAVVVGGIIFIPKIM